MRQRTITAHLIVAFATRHTTCARLLAASYRTLEKHAAAAALDRAAALRLLRNNARDAIRCMRLAPDSTLLDETATLLFAAWRPRCPDSHTVRAIINRGDDDECRIAHMPDADLNSEFQAWDCDYHNFDIIIGRNIRKYETE